VITAPVVAVREETELREVAWLLTAYRIKHVLVPRDDRIVGIVTAPISSERSRKAQTEPTSDARGASELLADPDEQIAPSGDLELKLLIVLEAGLELFLARVEGGHCQSSQVVARHKWGLMLPPRRLCGARSGGRFAVL
jgi:hypothetical protein